MKKIFILLTVFVSFAFSTSTIDECKTDVYFWNGILTDRQTAKYNAFKVLKSAIIEKFGPDYYKKHIGKVDYAYNHTEEQIADLIASVQQVTDIQKYIDKLIVL